MANCNEQVRKIDLLGVGLQLSFPGWLGTYSASVSTHLMAANPNQVDLMGACLSHLCVKFDRAAASTSGATGPRVPQTVEGPSQ